MGEISGIGKKLKNNPERFSTPFLPMRFEKLEIIGFKSFAEKTVVHFQPGMTAIVGPNGCGKSNIADAIRWVLGEQNAKQIRGERMDDVIFAGSTKRKPTGLAEVSLTISGVEGKISSEFREFSEITITRRLYRSGESDYLINKIHSRLRDIRDIFLDTGIGARAFSIMEQGRIDAVLTKEPQERRFIIEEVAGIMKYKARKTEALSRLESTEQNLVRVRDIIAEIKRQLGSLERQAKKAERYHTLQQQMKDAELVIARHTYAILAAQRREYDAESDAKRTAEAAAETSSASLENRMAEHRITMATAEKEVTDIQQGVHSLEKEIQQTEGAITLARSQVTSAMERRERARVEAARLETDLQNTTLLLEQQEKEGVEAEADLARQQAVLIEKNSMLLQKSKDLRQRETTLDEDKGELFQLVQQISDARNKIASWEAKEQNLSHREERRDTEIKETIKELESNGEALSVKREAEEKVKATILRYKQEQEQTVYAVKENQEKLAQCRKELAASRDTITRTGSRLHSLQELEKNLEGFQDGVKAVVKQKEKKLDGIHGVVAHFLTPAAGYEVAIEAALGERLQHVVVEDHRRGGEAANFLKTANSGRATFVPMRPYGGRTQGFAPTHPSPLTPHPSLDTGDSRIVGPALDLVECREGYLSVVEHLLGDVVVVRDLEAALSLWDGNHTPVTLVTLDGDIVYPSGAVTGGSTEKLKSGLLAKKREIKELETALCKAEEEHQTLTRQEEEMVRAERELTARRDELVRTLHAVHIEEVHCQKDIGALLTEIGRLTKKKELLEFEQEETRRERAELAGRMGEVKDTITSLTDRKEALETSIGEQQEGIGILRDEVEEMRGEVTRHTVTVTSLTGRKETAIASAARLRESMEGMQRRNVELATEEQEALAKRETSEAEITEAENRRMALVSDYERARMALDRAKEAVDLQTTRRREMEEELRSSRRNLETVREGLKAVEMKAVEVRLHMDHLCEGIMNRYGVDLGEAAVEEPSETGKPIEEVKKDLDELKRKLDELGPVNLAAVEEYRELKERHDFLTKQETDLSESIDSLRTAIHKINKTTETLFSEAFNAIDTRFRQMFTALFEGGTGQLVLTDPENLLETGVDIIVQPPGKKLQHISLMSGGEKTMTAIALLFACFQVKPSPFCLMDEVDAALDDTNVRRFAAALKSMTAQSQFTVITHNKGTMEQADALYGVTMEEPGVSRLISVALTEPTEAVEA